MSLKIAFHEPHLTVRGTSVALYDYARYNQELLGNESVIILPREGVSKSDPLAMVKFVSKFRVLVYNPGNLDSVLEEEKCDVLYCIKYGKNDGIFSRKIKTVIHCVFDMSEPHGNVYAGVSSELAKKFGSSVFVPHMVSLKPSETKMNLREKLNIPGNAIVFGRYGGTDTFDLPYNWKIIKKILEVRDDVYFLFINTPDFYHHDRILHLPVVTDDNEKNLFINTCDAHLEAGTLGHSFGLAIAENSINNKPVIAYTSQNLWNTAHISILKDKAIYFSNETELYNVLFNFKPEDYTGKDLNCYRDYTPEKVMEIFRTVFLA